MMLLPNIIFFLIIFDHSLMPDDGTAVSRYNLTV